jgi:hypothetical protein
MGSPETHEPAVGGKPGRAVDIQHGHDLILRLELRGDHVVWDRTTFATEPSPAGTVEEIKRWIGQMHDLESLRTPASLADLERELARHKKGATA